MSRSYLFIFSVILLGSLTSCDSVDPGLEESDYLVESYQVASNPLQPVRLTRTTTINDVYDITKLGVSGANVQINLLRDDNTVEKSYAFRERPGDPGLYFTESDDLVQPLRTYELDISLPDEGNRITARTVVPDTFRIVQVNADTVLYQGQEQFEVRVTRSLYPGRQTIFIFNTEALDPRPDRLTPFVRRIYEEEDVSLEELRISSAPPLNEANYTLNADGSLTIRMPWLMIFFYGPQRTTANAIDDNMYDFVRSWQVQQGGSTLSPGEIPNVIDHIEGGTGIFGSFASVSYDFYVRRPEE